MIILFYKILKSIIKFFYSTVIHDGKISGIIFFENYFFENFFENYFFENYFFENFFENYFFIFLFFYFLKFNFFIFIKNYKNRLYKYFINFQDL